MLRRLLLFTLLSSVFAATAQITVEQCVDLARENYPLIKKYDLLRQTRSIDLSDINKTWLPQLNAYGQATILQSIFVMFAFIMIFQLMGGLFTPVSSMPQWAQYITYAVPPRYFIEIMRAVYLKGAGIADLWPQYLSLAAFALLLCSVAALTYRKRA